MIPDDVARHYPCPHCGAPPAEVALHVDNLPSVLCAAGHRWTRDFERVPPPTDGDVFFSHTFAGPATLMLGELPFDAEVSVDGKVIATPVRSTVMLKSDRLLDMPAPMPGCFAWADDVGGIMYEAIPVKGIAAQDAWMRNVWQADHPDVPVLWRCVDVSPIEEPMTNADRELVEIAADAVRHSEPILAKFARWARR